MPPKRTPEQLQFLKALLALLEVDQETYLAAMRHYYQQEGTTRAGQRRTKREREIEQLLDCFAIVIQAREDVERRLPQPDRDEINQLGQAPGQDKKQGQGTE